MLVKMAKNSNQVEGEKNKVAYDIDKIDGLEFFVFKSKEENKIKASLKIILNGNERILWGNNKAEIDYLEKMFDKWVISRENKEAKK
jgi:hypothetical protein